jgi:hypothetical protein
MQGDSLQHPPTHEVEHKGWGDPNILERREDRIDVAVNDVCAKHQALCDGIEKKVDFE